MSAAAGTGESGQVTVVGLVGAIGAGKSRVAARWAERGAAVIDGDRVGHEALRRPDAVAAVLDRFGPGVGDGQGGVDRRALGRVAFADPAAKAALEAILHPPMKVRFDELLAAAKADPAVPLVAFDAAVLLEAGWRDRVDRLLFVDAPRAERLARVADRGWDAAELDRREASQWPLAAKRAAADAVLDNAGPWQDARADAYFDQWARAAGPTPDL